MKKRAGYFDIRHVRQIRLKLSAAAAVAPARRAGMRAAATAAGVAFAFGPVNMTE